MAALLLGKVFGLVLIRVISGDLEEIKNREEYAPPALEKRTTAWHK